MGAFERTLEEFLEDGIDYNGGNIKIALLDSGYTPSATADHFWSDISTHECAASGDYTAGGITLSPSLAAGSSVVVDTNSYRIANTASLTNVQHAVVYQDTGTASTSPLIAYSSIASGAETINSDHYIYLNGIENRLWWAYIATGGGQYILSGRAMSDANIDFVNDTIKAALVTTSYTWASNHEFWDDITNEASGSGYTTGGQALTGKTLTYDTNRVVADCDDLIWNPVTFTNVNRVVIYKDTGTASTSPLLYSDTFTTKTASAEYFRLDIGSDGLFQTTIT